MEHGKRRGREQQRDETAASKRQQAAKADDDTPGDAALMEEEDMDEHLAFEEDELDGAYEQEEELLREMDQEMAEHQFSGADMKFERYARPAVKSFDPNEKAITFQQLDIDYYFGDSSHMIQGRKRVAILRIFGVTEEGHSVCAFVHGFEPYFYARAPAGCSPDDVRSFSAALERAMKEQGAGKGGGGGGGGGGYAADRCVTSVQLERKQGVFYYQAEEAVPFFKITLAVPTMVPACRGILERGLAWGSFPAQAAVTYESNVLFTLRFMIDAGIVGGNWVELPAGKYYAHDPNRPMTTCQLEMDILSENLVSHPSTGAWSKVAPFRILSFDIECCGRKGMFPEPDKDPVIQIGNLLTVQGQSRALVQVVLTLQSCAPIVGADVASFEEEKDLLLAWRNLVEKADPDLIIGYNIAKFDLPYLIERAEKLQVKPFNLLGRIRGSMLRMRDTKFQSRQYGVRESKDVTIEGRVQFDLIQAIQRDHKLSSYSLNSVSAHFLGEQKEDVHHSIIADLQHGDAQTRRRLAVYCLKDAYLPQRLLDRLMYVYNYVEMARVTGVPISFLLARGQSIKVLSQILRKARQRNLLVPNLKVAAAAAQETYEGATVLDAKQGYYDRPVATLDFASLYPSIMMAHNLCYCTLVRREELPRLNLPADKLTKSPTGDVFVSPELRKGILPEILEELLAARKRAKADLKAATDPFEKAVLDGRQLALKISANSVYGFTGATVGALPCLEISSSVTSYGRAMIEHTRNLVEERYSVKNGYAHDANVVYGDTDSVMVLFGESDVAGAMKLGQEAATHITQTFPTPIRLEFEKVYWPYLLINKKRYAGLVWTRPEKYDKMDTKGIETVRRDNCLLVRRMVDECLRRILIDRDKEGAVSYVKSTISDLLMNRMDLSLLVITKGLMKEDYAVKAAHVELADRMRKRDPATAPVVGDRVPYVMVKAPKGAKGYEKSEDPIHVLENNIPIDAQYYLENQLSKPLLRIFDPILKNASRELLYGDHTRSVSISTPSSASGGIMKFAKIRPSCLGCKTPLSGAHQTLCLHCKSKEAQVYSKTMAQVRACEDEFSKLWVQCQRCQGSLHMDVLCTSRDCPIFYRRKKAQKEVEEAHSQLARFDF